MKKIILLLSFFIAYSSTCLGAIINNFDVAITVSESGELIIRETIKVTTNGNQIKRGIIRDIPTDYKTSEGFNVDIGFNLISVKKDGVDTPYKIFSKSNGVSIRIGQRNVILPPGQYRYEISYTVNRAIGFFKNHDELYWNVTGNGWKFPIEHATAEVFLPTDAAISKITAYTGAQGQTGKEYRQHTPHSNQAVIVTTKPLNAFQGLTIAIAWPKGIITEPTTADKLNWLITDNTSLVFLVIMLLIIITFYLLCWSQLGKDNLNQTAFPLYQPPKGFSPQALAYIKNMRYDDSLFSTAIIQMAVKGFLSISKKKTSII